MTRQPNLLVLPRPSRYDKVNDGRLIGPARNLVDEVLSDYEIKYAAEFTRDDIQHYRKVVVTGQESLDKWYPGHDLTTERGFVWNLGATKLVATFWPQDCVDLQDNETYDGQDDEIDAKSTGKDTAPTARANYRFWFLQDVRKLERTFTEPTATYLPVFGKTAVAMLQRRGAVMFFDIETNPDSNALLCFSWAFDDGVVYTTNVYDHNRQLVPGAHDVIVALTRAFKSNKIVIHNAFFDLPFLALFHNIPFGPDIEDTMLMHHRVWPEAEKSLAHVISLYINARYHKGEGGSWNPRSGAQMTQLMQYNSKDVWRLREVWLQLHDIKDPGIRASIAQVNESIYPYLYTSLHGMPVDGMKLVNYRRDRKARAVQLNRVVDMLVGQPLNPASSQQLGTYFVQGMGYDCLARTEGEAPSVDESTLYKYLIKYRNPLIPVILKYKRATKVASDLGFQFWEGIKYRKS
jgi:hypothetical protein